MTLYVIPFQKEITVTMTDYGYVRIATRHEDKDEDDVIDIHLDNLEAFYEAIHKAVDGPEA